MFMEPGKSDNLPSGSHTPGKAGGRVLLRPGGPIASVPIGGKRRLTS